jgi:hypothetical protein
MVYLAAAGPGLTLADLVLIKYYDNDNQTIQTLGHLR